MVDTTRENENKLTLAANRRLRLLTHTTHPSKTTERGLDSVPIILENKLFGTFSVKPLFVQMALQAPKGGQSSLHGVADCQ